MALGCEMDDTGHMLLLHEGIDGIKIADVRTHKAVVGFILNIFEVREIARVGQLIHIDDAVLGVLVHEETYHMTSDKSGSAGDDDRFHYNE